MKAKNCIVVGAGLFGAVAATLARSLGHTVTVIDGGRPGRASPASGCVLAPSWLSSLSREEVDVGMGVLGDLYKVHDLALLTDVGVYFKAKRVDPDEVLAIGDVIFGEVTEVGDGWVKYSGDDGSKKLTGHVLVATGAWAGELIPGMPPIKGLFGASVRFRGQVPEPRVSAWAPYKQVVVFQLNKNTVWGGDGSALVERTWKAEYRQRVEAMRERVLRASGIPTLAASKVTTGIRPFVEGRKSGYFERVSPRLAVSTGGGKNGTVLAALQAQRWVETLK